MRFDICGTSYKNRGEVVSKRGIGGEKVYKKSDRIDGMQSLGINMMDRRNIRKDQNVNQF
jgi:hypothetical protein